MTSEKQDYRRIILNHLTYSLSKDMYSATERDKYNAIALSVRTQVVKKWIKTQQHYYNVDAKRLYYLSLEFLLGRLLKNYLINLGLVDEYKEAADVLATSLEDALEHEWDAGLGNGGLGRLAACFLDSMATLQYPCYGYGIRYEYGIFTQKIKDGYQTEAPDNWLRYGNPWEFARPELLYPVHFYGRVEVFSDGRTQWVDTDEIMAMAYDYPIPGYHNEVVNTLRLWAAKSTRDFNFEYFNSGDYVKAVEDKNNSENISKVLYPNDLSFAGKELRLKQQYFFVAATLGDIMRRYKKFHTSYNTLPEKVSIQLNDTHPSISIAELMRVLIDEEGLPWDVAQKITMKTFGYTNHTILPEALETWPEGLLGNLLPRHLQIIREIDRKFLVYVTRRFPDEPERRNNMALVTGDGEKTIHMARLAIVGSHTVNGVSRLHSELLKTNVFPDFYLMFPERFQNVTNGITHRRWLLEANPELSGLISESIGDRWTKDLEELKRLEPFAEDSEFRKRFAEIKENNKMRLLKALEKDFHLSFEPQFLLDCQVKRFHEYKRQLLNVLHAITLYNRIREGRVDEGFTPRTIMFSGKSAPGYTMCKLIIKLIHNVAEVISAHPQVRNKLQIVFVPNYGVTLAQLIMPAADLSEQISTAGYEASGTGNMKFTLNGALTIGTLDGANVEIREEVGQENFFLFGLTADEIIRLRQGYNPRQFVEQNKELAQVMDQLSSDFFSPENRGYFQPIVESLLESDHYCVLADYASYIACQEEVGRAYKEHDRWVKMAVLNVARSGKFSSDRAIREYAENIWHITPQDV
ncbi:MAG TPA: glycogen/starch/alpha-glucan phosphorylase [Syntrophorhabdaceae bacterium]|nr:glycogen/starch/alpha-glucan phosphorylase [Syntrophorhabdaceae bacterium]HQM82328.1 glycogen/starch/alpha-glucan phosphorylase [Syntrophorhabdaceae bacterium]